MTAAAPIAAPPARALRGAEVSPGVWEMPVPGAFDLGQTIRFGFGQRAAISLGPVLPLAFCVDRTWEQVGALVSAPRPDLVRIAVEGNAAPAAVAAQVARMLSLDVDATGYDALGDRHPLVGRLQRARPGLRPPLFHSAYEALLWAVLSHRQNAARAARLRGRLSALHGRVLQVAGHEVAAVPTPEQLLGLTDLEGLPDGKLSRLHAIAASALAGELDTDALRALDPAEAAARLRTLPGIGPFFSELVVVRTLGHTDVLPSVEVGAAEMAGKLLGREVDVAGLAELAEAWTPWRTWVCVALRAAGPAALVR